MHSRLIADAEEALNQGLPPNYVASIGERVYVVQSDRSIEPDAMVVCPRSAGASPGPTKGAEAAVADDASGVLTTYPTQTREGFVEIRSTVDDEVVTVIEFLSPRNKASGPGRNLYLQKQSELVNSTTNLIQVDLLRRGAHTVAPPRAELVKRGT